MTPLEVLNDAKARFMILYYKEQPELERLLRQALGKFQDKAGVILEKWNDEPEFALPEHFHAADSCCDTKRRYVPYRFKKNDNGKTIISLLTDSRHESPYCLMYFCDLRNWPFDKDLPGDCDALLCDYLEALIALINVKMEREAYFGVDMRDGAATFPSDSELRQRVAELEQEMENNKAIIMPASMF